MNVLNAALNGFNLAMDWTKSKEPPALDPMQTIVTLALLSFRPDKTKLGFRQYSIQLQDGNAFQGVTRWWNSDSNDDNRHLDRAVKKCIGYYRNEEIKGIYRLAVEGLKKLQKTYEEELPGNLAGQLIGVLEPVVNSLDGSVYEFEEPADPRTLAWKVKQLWDKDTLSKYVKWLESLEKCKEKKTDGEEFEYDNTLPVIEAHLIYQNTEFIRIVRMHNRPET